MAYRKETTMHTVFLVDLDDCLITQRVTGEKARLVEPPDNGRPASFQTRKQQLLLDRLRQQAVVIPTTGRSASAFRHIQLGFHSHAICSFGGTILTVDNRFEPGWRKVMQEQIKKHRRTFRDVYRSIEVDTEYNPQVISDGGLTLYIRLRHSDQTANEQTLSDAAAELNGRLPEGWRLFRNGIHCCVQPPYIGKEKAVRWYLEHRAPNAELVIGLGDSFTDAAFLGVCDLALLPTDSQLFAAIAGKTT
jgi:hydroxymethylpyrimidine pyrophosphatase-like HAD family hydrolase